MSRERNLVDRDGGWRSLALAAAAASGVVLLLAVIIGALWLVGGAPTSGPVISAQPAPTPTPRSLAFLSGTPAPTPPPGQREPPGDSTVSGDLPSSASAPASSTAPALMSVPNAEGFTTLSNGAVFSAPDDSPFALLAAGSWEASADMLRNDGSSADAEPPLSLASAPTANVAIEAEIKINGVLESFCDQSFGLAGGDPSAGRFFGGGVMFPCAGDNAHARLTDASTWQDGFHADPLIAENEFDPGGDWRTYRFELRGDTLRLIVDGVGIVSGALESPLDDSVVTEAGIWSQGVDLDVRSIKIFPLPDE